MKKLSTVFFLMLMPMMSIAQTGTIKARVIDAKTGKELKRVVVKILETKQGAISKTDGYATIINVKPATNYTLYVLFAGYRPRAVSGVQVIPNTSTDLLISLSTSSRHDDFAGSLRYFDTNAAPTIRLGSTAMANVPCRNNLDQLTQLTPGVISDNSTGHGYMISSNCNFGRRHSDPNYCTPPNRGSVMIDTPTLQTTISRFALSEFNCPTSGAQQTPTQQKSITITPNPSNGIVRLSFASDDENAVAIYIYNPRGAIVRTIRDDAVTVGDWSTTINMSDCVEGTYVVQLIQGTDVRMGRFMLLKQ